MDLKDFFHNEKSLNLDKSEVLHRPDETCKSLGYLLSGRLVMKKYLSTGKELYLTEFKAGDIFGELLVLSGEKYKGWLVAEEPSQVFELSYIKLNKLLSDPAYKTLYFREISRRVSRMTERIEILSYKKVSDRIIIYLINHFEEGKPFRINISLLSDILDCSREALSRTVSSLEKENLLVKHGRFITIRRVADLEERLSIF
ncbi:MAG: Crp/Fnr family transcriptional regulator [Spirochaetales bacterium]|nr:Crp/Fnr family transcriptional regulator [Spirochaetales bacterium]